MKGTNIRWCSLLVFLGSSWAIVAQDPVPLATEAGENWAVYRVDIHVYQIPVSSTADDEGILIDGGHILQKIDNGKLVPVLKPDQNTAVFGPIVELSVRGLRWAADKDGLDLPDPDALKESLVEVVARPSILLPLGESAEFRIGSDQPVQYFIQTEDDSVFELQTEQEFVGYVFGCTLTRSDETEGGLSAKITSAIEGVGGLRRPVPGLSLNVGRPMTTENHIRTIVTFRPKDWFALVQRTWDRSSIVLTLVTVREHGG